MSLTKNTLATAGLKLFALQHQGQPQDFVWVWQGQAHKAGFDDILGAMGVDDAQLLTHARFCTVERMGSVANPFWLLGNSSHAMVCSVNQRTLAAGSQIRLDHGDEIELGLTRFVVSLEAGDARPMQAVSALDAPRPEVDSAFDLTDLDALADVTNLPETERYGVNRADFSDLISFTPEEQAIAPAPVAAVPAAAPAEPTLAEALAAGTQPSYQEKVSDLLAQFGRGAEAARQEEAPLDDDPLAALHEQYLYKLRNPNHSDQTIAWQSKSLDEQAKQPDPLHYWQNKAGKERGLDDLLGQSQTIDSVLQGLDALGSSDVTAPEPFESVMHLFAPENLRLASEGSIESLVQRSLPGLTRREHHSLSLDSAMPLTGGEPAPTKNNKP